MRLAVFAVVVAIAGCSGSGDHGIELDTLPSGVATTVGGSGPLDGTTTTAGAATAGATTATSDAPADVTVTIDASAPGATISPAILGVSSTLTADELNQAGLTVNSWGGNPSTRYNYDIGHAWNNGADWEFRNTNYGADPGSDTALAYVLDNEAAGVQTRMAIPTLGWVAANDDDDDCSFPKEGGGCLAAADVGNCQDPKLDADPTRANVESTPELVQAWLTRMAAAGAVPDYIAMDNEPDLWGYTHYDVHPECPTFEEILDKYLAYAGAARAAMPDVALTGPVLCCWYDYWNTGPAPADGSDEDFLSWFLDGVKAHDDRTGARSIDYLDVHFYPQSDVFNDKDDDETNARRLRSTRALWDPEYQDESWIDTEIRFIPRMREAIAAHYPGLKLMISEWNFGNETKINGALAIADVLGIYGREGVDAAAYWRNPPVGSPGWFAFTMHGNYDGKGTRFDGAVVPVDVGDDDRIGAYGALDPASQVLRVMFVNRDPDEQVSVGLDVLGSTAGDQVSRYSYSPATPDRIVSDTVAGGAPIALPASSITVLELEPR